MVFRSNREELVEKYGALTICQRSPAKGFKDDDGGRAIGAILIFLSDDQRGRFVRWKRYRWPLEARFNQKSPQ